MTKPVAIPNTFATQTGNVPAAELDANYTALAASINDLGTYANAGVDTGTSNNYIIGFTAGITVALVNGLTCTFIPLNANTGGSTINVGGTGALPLLLATGGAIPSGVIQTGVIYQVIYSSSTNSWYLNLTANTAVLSNPGYEISSSGKIEQWGNSVLTTNASAFATVTFPLSFPNNVFTFLPTIGDNNHNGLTVQNIQSAMNVASATVVVFQNNSAYTNQTFRMNWIAIGN